jgi:hypothetical protein
MRVPARPRPRTPGGLVALFAAPLLGGVLLAGVPASGVPLPGVTSPTVVTSPAGITSPAGPSEATLATATASAAAPDDDALATLARSSVPATDTPTLAARDEPLAAAPPVAVEEPTAPPEPYPGHEPQTSCEVVDHVGIERFRDVVLAAHPDTGDGGIVRDCHAGGTSEHKEGRAWDWMLDAHQPQDAAAADEVLTWLLAEDADGTPHALARRLGVLYVIWDGRIWSAARADQGWQPYTGASPHTDHVHLSFSSAGARGETSFFADVWDPAVGAEYPATMPAEDDVLALGVTPPA